MTLIKPSRIEWNSYFVLMPAVAFALNAIFFEGRIWTDSRIWLFSFPFIGVQCFFSWYLHVVLMYWLRRKMPHIAQTPLRLVLLALLHVGYTYGSYALLFYTYDATNFLGFRLTESVYVNCLLLSIALTMITNSVWEANHTFQLWRNSLAQKEKLQQSSFEKQFEMLKSQVNPHFLFNCFNTLSSLITEDPDAAESFLNELSKVYRYLLRNNRDSLSTVQSELQFIESYHKLLQTRHGEAVVIRTKIDKRYQQYLLPSLSLQLLVENAVKHNTASRQSPLVIDIFTTAGNLLVVNNNLQKRASKAASNKVGLENIRSKFALMKHQGFQVLEDNKNFTVVLPLLWASALEDNALLVHEQAKGSTNKIQAS